MQHASFITDVLCFVLQATRPSVSGVLVVSFVKQHFVQQSPGHLGVGLQLLPNEHGNVLNCAVKRHGREVGEFVWTSSREECP